MTRVKCFEVHIHGTTSPGPVLTYEVTAPIHAACRVPTRRRSLAQAVRSALLGDSAAARAGGEMQQGRAGKPRVQRTRHANCVHRGSSAPIPDRRTARTARPGSTWRQVGATLRRTARAARPGSSKMSPDNRAARTARLGSSALTTLRRLASAAMPGSSKISLDNQNASAVRPGSSKTSLDSQAADVPIGLSRHLRCPVSPTQTASA